ncbi:MAG: DUF6268 family outer membrane beta-barrel protein [Phycisphaerales bacterium]|jgi:hypothetical protein
MMPRLQRPVSLAAAMLFVSGVATNAFAQPTSPANTSVAAPAAPTEAPSDQVPKADDAPPVRASLDLFGAYSASTDFHSNRGSLSTARGGAGLGVKIPLAEGRSIGLSFSGEYSNYDFSNATGFAGSAADGPWKDITILSVGINYAAEINKQWGYFLGVSGDASWERGADFDHSLTISGVGGVTYAVSDDLQLGFGLAGGTRLEDDAYAVPIVTANWKITDKLRLSTNTGFGNRSIGLGLGYDVTDTLTLSLSAGFESREFRLDRNGPIPNGVGRDYRLPILLSARWQVDPQVIVNLGVGTNVWGQIRAENSNGDRLSQEELSPGFVVGGGVEFKF